MYVEGVWTTDLNLEVLFVTVTYRQLSQQQGKTSKKQHSQSKVHACTLRTGQVYCNKVWQSSQLLDDFSMSDDRHETSVPHSLIFNALHAEAGSSDLLCR